MTKQVDGQLNLFDFIPETRFLKELPGFKECTDCWCYDCKHNSNNEAEPRDFAGELKSCPACDFCISNNKAEICIIDSYKNGCKVRAKEEGINENQ